MILFLKKNKKIVDVFFPRFCNSKLNLDTFISGSSTEIDNRNDMYICKRSNKCDICSANLNTSSSKKSNFFENLIAK